MSEFTTPANTSDSDKQKREEELELNREMYEFDQTYLPPISTLKLHREGTDLEAVGMAAAEPKSGAEIMLPDHLLRAVEMIAGDDSAEEEVIKTVAETEHVVEVAEADLEGIFGPAVAEYDKDTGVPKQEVPPLFSYLLPRGVNNFLSERKRKKLIANSPPLNNPPDYQAYLEPFSDIDKFNGFSDITSIWDQDSIFGWQRLAGVNPRVIQALNAEKLTTLLEKMPLKDEHIAAIAGAGATLDGEVASNRLYYSDYALLDGLPMQAGRHLHPCIGVFWSNAAGNQLLPVAIQLTQTPGRVRTPADADWEMARLHFQVADFNYHEMGTHLSEAHFAQEAFVIGARRNLPNKHPIGAFLYQIYFALLYNNTLGRLQLVNKGGFVEKMMAGELETGSLAIVSRFYRDEWKWDDWNLDTFLTNQGTTDTTALPTYPYRDDGLPLYKAIQKFTAAYVAAWYDQDSDVQADNQIKDWVADLVAPDKGNLAVKGFPTAITTRGGLAEVLARLAWQASAGHGGINYSQYQYFAWVPNSPGAAYSDDAPFMAALPAGTPTAYQLNILNVLTYKIFGRLGEYDSSFSSGLNNDAKGAVNDFRNALKGLSDAVASRNATFPRTSLTYPWLDPAQLPNSTNI